MSQASGTRVGPYEIVALIGVGGMGEVYRARDSRLGRDVALKVLPELFTRDTERMARFDREAQLLASLNHPNIAMLHGLEESGSVRALVMELVEGPTLAERIAQGPLPLDEALPIARQIAEALEAAHDRGIIHRDLKPANIKLRPDGAVKVLDFGLAKALDEDPAVSSAANSPTMSLGATRAGVILGTAAYMSPEQAKGKIVDRRADIWAFGVALYEMLAGKQLFGGETTADSLAAVLTKDTGIDTRLPGTPAAIRTLLRRCLDRDPKKRLRDIGEARIAIDEFASRPAPESVPATDAATPARRPVAWMTLAAVATLAAVVLGYVLLRQSVPVGRVLRYSIPTPENSGIFDMALSADGRNLAITVTEGTRHLWVRALDAQEAQKLPGTEGAQSAFWSPDGRWIGFLASGKLKKIAVTGGPPQTLCEAPAAQGGAWNREGVILLGSGVSGIQRVPAAGGSPVMVTKPDGGGNHSFPVFLPDGRRFLYTAGGDGRRVLSTAGEKGQGGVYAGSLDGQPAKTLLSHVAVGLLASSRYPTPTAYVPAYSSAKTGHVLFLRESMLMALPVQESTLDAAGEPFPVAEQMAFGLYANHAPFAASRDGLLVFQAGGNAAGNQLQWVDRAGKTLAKVGAPLKEIGFMLSPDEKSVATWDFNSATTSDIWLRRLDRGADTRLTFHASRNTTPVWSPDGRRVAFSSSREQSYDIYWKDVAAGGQDELVLRSPQYKVLCDWSPDGRSLLFVDFAKKSADLWTLALDAGGERKPVPFLESEFNETQGQFSPDGRSIAYSSDESGKLEIYVRPFPVAPGKWPVSVGGGRLPRWRNDGREIYYLSPDNKVMAAAVKASSGPRPLLEAGVPQALFDPHIPRVSGLLNWFPYTPSADGKRFLVNTAAAVANQAPLTVVVNWLDAVRK